MNADHEATTSSPQRAPTLERGGRWLAALLGLTLLVFAHTLTFDFVTYDDDQYVLSPMTLAWWNAPPIEQLTTPHIGYPIPLALMLYSGVRNLIGLLPVYFHGLNVLVHLLNVTLVFALVRALGARPAKAAACTAIWAFHPIIAESVSWVTGLKDLLCLNGALVATLGGLNLSNQPATPLRSWALVILGVFLSIGAKPTGVMIAPLLFVLGLVAARARETSPSRPLLGMATGLSLLGAAYSLYVKAAHDAFGGHSDLSALSAIVAAINLQIQNLLVPLSLSPRYAYYEPHFHHYLVAAGTVAAIAWIVIEGIRRQRIALALGGAWIALFYLPVSNLSPLQRFTADSYLYIPLVGVCFILSDLIPNPVVSRRSKSAWALGILLAALLTFHQSKVWTNGITLWSRALEFTEEDDRDFIHQKLGQSYALYQECTTAIKYFEMVDTERYGRTLPFAVWWPWCYAHLGHEQRADELYREGLRRMNTAPPGITDHGSYTEYLRSQYQDFLRRTGRPPSSLP